MRTEFSNNREYKIVRTNGNKILIKNDKNKKLFSVIYWNQKSGKYEAPNYGGDGEWYGSIDYVADWVSYPTAVKRFVGYEK